MAESFDGSTPRPKSYRIRSLRGFLPLSDSDNALSTRGQTLPSLIQSRSSANMQDLKAQLAQRRPVTPDMIDDEESGIHNGVAESRIDNDDLSPAKSIIGRGVRRMSGLSDGREVLMTPQMRSMRLIGNSNPRYQWDQYYKSDEELKNLKKPVRKYYERNNRLIGSYLYIDRLLDSSLPHNLIQEYNHDHCSNGVMNIPHTIPEESNSPSSPSDGRHPALDIEAAPNGHTNVKVKRTPKALYKLPDENTPLLGDDSGNGPQARDFRNDDDEDVDSGSKVVTVAIYVNLAANAILLAGKVAVIVLSSSLSVLASLVDAALDFLSTAIVWVTTKLISRKDQYSYPVGRRRLEPLGETPFCLDASIRVAFTLFEICTY